MKKRILKNFTPFLLSMFWVILALGIELAPKTPGTSAEILHNFFKRIDYLIYDIRQLSTLHLSFKQRYPIAIIAIDDKSLIQEGQWPWSYSKIAKLISKLRAMGAQIIALNIMFTEQENNIATDIKYKLMEKNAAPEVINELKKLEPEFDGNAKLITEVQHHNDIVLTFILLSTSFNSGQLTSPIYIIAPSDVKNFSIISMPGYITNYNAIQNTSSYNGFTSSLTDEDGIIRRTPVVLLYKNQVFASLPLAMAQAMYPEKKIKLNFVKIGNKKILTSVKLGDLEIPTDKGGRVLIPFNGKSHSFPYYSASDILKNNITPNQLKNTVVIIAHTASGVDKVRNTSVDIAMPESEIQANVLNGILTGKFPVLPFWGKYLTIAITIIIGTVLSLLLPILSPPLAILLASGVLILLIIMNIGLWIALGIVFSFSIPLLMSVMLVLTNMAYGFLFEDRKKRFLREAFGQYVAPEYVQYLLENPQEYSLDGESVELTVLFTDIRSFTTISEDMSANVLKQFLNHYFTPMTEIIFKHKGTIDKYVGDMIMAFWGAPIKNINHREAAIDAALEMLEKSYELKTAFLKEGLPEIKIGVGINSGLMNVGDMGSFYRRAYTVLGDPVNLASRLESATKYYGVELLVGGETRNNLDMFLFRWVDKVIVKGKHKAMDIYEVICRMSEASPEQLKEIEKHHQAMDAYFNQNWEIAAQIFESLAKDYPQKKLYKLFIKRIVDFKKNPPEADWDGSYSLTEK